MEFFFVIVNPIFLLAVAPSVSQRSCDQKSF